MRMLGYPKFPIFYALWLVWTKQSCPARPQLILAVVAAVDERGEYYVLGDYIIHETPKKWAQEIIAAHYKHSADIVIGKVNHGGELMKYTLRKIDPNVSYSSVRVSRGKQTRVEPISALYKQEKVHHVGSFPSLEDQMCD